MTDNMKLPPPPRRWRGPITATACGDCGAPLLFGVSKQIDSLPMRCPCCAQRETRVLLLSAALRLSVVAERLERGADDGAEIGAADLRELGERLSDRATPLPDRGRPRQIRRRKRG